MSTLPPPFLAPDLPHHPIAGPMRKPIIPPKVPPCRRRRHANPGGVHSLGAHSLASLLQPICQDRGPELLPLPLPSLAGQSPTLPCRLNSPLRSKPFPLLRANRTAFPLPPSISMVAPAPSHPPSPASLLFTRPHLMLLCVPASPAPLTHRTHNPRCPMGCMSIAGKARGSWGAVWMEVVTKRGPDRDRRG